MTVEYKCLNEGCTVATTLTFTEPFPSLDKLPDDPFNPGTVTPMKCSDSCGVCKVMNASGFFIPCCYALVTDPSKHCSGCDICKRIHAYHKARIQLVPACTCDDVGANKCTGDFLVLGCIPCGTCGYCTQTIGGKTHCDICPLNLN